ncbi:adenosine receptor A3-like [Oculina patagonica]
MEDVYLNSTLNASLANTTAANVTQSTTLSPPTYLQQPLAATVFQITLWSTIVFLGVIGNILVCTVILSNPKMKTSMNYYLLSLAIADLGVLLIIYPMVVLKYLSPRWIFGEQACYYLYPTVEIFFGASIWSITAIAIERYRNVVGKKRYQIRHRSRNRGRTWLVIGTVWLASFLVSCVPLYPVMTYDSITDSCYPKWPDMDGKNAFFLTYLTALIVVWYVLPLIVIAFTYFTIRRRVRDSVVFRNSMSVDGNGDQTVFSQSLSNRERRVKGIWRQSNKATRILTPLVILFAVTMFPVNALRVLALTLPGYWMNTYYYLIMGQVIMFIMINSAANPLVYFITSKEFKDAFKKIFKSLRDKKNFFKLISSKSSTSSKTWNRAGKREENQGQRRNNKKISNGSRVELVKGDFQIVTGL